MYGIIATTDTLTIAAEVNNAVAVSSSSNFVTVDSFSSAEARMGRQAIITANALCLTAYTGIDVDVTVSDIFFGSTRVTSQQQTFALVEGGATLQVGTGSISADEQASFLVQARDSSTIQTLVSFHDDAIS